MLEVNEADFSKEILDSDIPVVVDFHAIWCGPCRMVAPVLDELSKTYDGKVKFVKVDVDKHSTASTDYQIMSIPTVAIFKQGKIVSKKIGAVGRKDYEDMINTALGSK
jgi:thioredoxin 1